MRLAMLCIQHYVQIITNNASIQRNSNSMRIALSHLADMRSAYIAAMIEFILYFIIFHHRILLYYYFHYLVGEVFFHADSGIGFYQLYPCIFTYMHQATGL